MRVPLLVIGACIVLLAMGPLALSLYTASKLERMRMVRGELAGARLVTGSVDRKWVERSPNGDVHYLELHWNDRGRVDSERDNVEASEYDRLEVGGPIRVAILPDGDVELPDGIWASSGNLAFDRGLLVGERVVAGVLLVVGLGMVGTGIALTLRQPR
jgi:hypothetical protein